tara:strand:+ start:522 stop:914 length:393 start_codon:yes stop_codon:yes gene_type:complete
LKGPINTVNDAFNPLTFHFGRYKEDKNFSLEDVDLNTEQSISRQTKVVNALGMHARPAAKIAEMAGAAKGNIWLSTDGATVDASSIIDILTLCAVTGTKITIHTDDPEDSAVAEEIKTFFDQGFGENIHE